MARKIRQLIVDLQTAGFQLVPGGKGSHRKFRHPRFPGAVILSGKDGDDALLIKKDIPQRCSRRKQMKTEDRYLKFVRWSEEDKAYVGYCPDLFRWGGVCHGNDEEQTYRDLRALVAEEIKQLIADGKDLPPPITRPMRELAGV